MASCLDNIVTIKPLCGNTVSVSGYDLMNAPEISYKQVAAIANEQYVKGLHLLQAKLGLAVTDVKNDFIGLIHSKGFAIGHVGGSFDSGVFNPNIQNPASSAERGLVVYAAPAGRGLSRLSISEISIYPLVSATGVPVKIYDNGNVYSYLFDLVANQKNIFQINHLMQGSFAKVVFNQTDIPTASSRVTCFVGCDGKLPNPCGFIKGFNGSNETSTEAFGLNIKFGCVCEYESILCGLAKSYTGKLVWLKARLHVMQEHLSSTRFNNIVIYGRERIEELKKEVQADYDKVWNELSQSLPQLLKGYQGSCIDCNGIKKVVNV